MVESSSVGREASLDTQGVMVFLQDMELVIGKEVVLGLHGVRMVEKSNMNREVTEVDHGGIHVVEIVVWLAVVSTLVMAR